MKYRIQSQVKPDWVDSTRKTAPYSYVLYMDGSETVLRRGALFKIVAQNPKKCLGRFSWNDPPVTPEDLAGCNKATMLRDKEISVHIRLS